MLARKLGAEIDRYDAVVRQKRCAETLRFPEHYGIRTDYVCGSLSIASTLPAHVPGARYWVFVDSRHSHIPDSVLRKTEDAVPCTILRGVCDRWNELYRSRRVAWEKHPQMREFDPLGHPHLSAGFHTILYACELLHPARIDLMGFDNIQTGTFTWSITRGPGYGTYPDHRWDMEHRMIPEVAGHYGVEIRFV
jgi:hypothetical protein